MFYLVAGYVLVLVAAFFMQRHLQYFPDRSPPGDPAKSDAPTMKEIFVRTDDGLTLRAWFAPPKEKDGRIVVFYHGNGGHMGHRAVKAQYFIGKGYGVYFCEYRGYGGNAGRHSEDGFFRDGRAALKWLDAQGYSVAQLVLYGESLGSGVAVQMALEIQPHILILESPFTSAVDVAKGAYPWLPVEYLMWDRYENLKKIGRIKTNLLIVHGDEDNVVPHELGKALYEAANHPKEFVSINGGAHNDLYEHHAGHVILEWLERQVKAELQQ